jgi:dephospho-CoA kinase
VVHELYEQNEVTRAVVERFGSSVAPTGSVDRAALAKRAFATAEDRQWLEGILWPRVGARIMEWREELARRPEPPRAAVVEVPLLFEAGMEAAFDATIAVIAPEDVRAERAGGRGHEALDERLARQLSQGEKSRLATFTVVNDGEVDELETELADVLDILRR